MSAASGGGRVGSWAWAALLLTACGAAASDRIDTAEPDDGFEPPDVSGSYDAELTELEGCAEREVPIGWASGPLIVSGAAGALVWNFDDVHLAGSIDSSFGWTIGDFAEVDGWGLDVQVVGLAYIQRDLWVLEGDFAVDAVDPDGETCTLTGVLVAREREE